jgi:hypothetical protein
MQYGDMRHHNHCHSSPPPTQGGTVISVPIGAAKEDCCAELRAEIKALKNDLVRVNKQLAALPDFANMGAGVLTSNGAKPATIAPQLMADLAKALSPLLDRDRFFDAFGNEIPRRPG